MCDHRNANYPDIKSQYLHYLYVLYSSIILSEITDMPLRKVGGFLALGACPRWPAVKGGGKEEAVITSGGVAIGPRNRVCVDDGGMVVSPSPLAARAAGGVFRAPWTVRACGESV